MSPPPPPRLVSSVKQWLKPRSAPNHGNYAQVAAQDPEVHPFLAADSQDRDQDSTLPEDNVSPSHEKPSLAPFWARGERFAAWGLFKSILIAILLVAILAVAVAAVATLPSDRQLKHTTTNPDSSRSSHHTTTEHAHNHDGTDLETPSLQNRYLMENPCGHTAAEARKRGCHFDIISFSWFAPPCYDAGLSKDFDDLATWEWFMDPNQTEPVSHERVMTGEYDGLYVRWEYHVRHCTAMWLKMHRAVLGGGKAAIDSYIGELSHTKHCGDMLLTRDSALEEVNTIILLKFPHCGIA